MDGLRQGRSFSRLGLLSVLLLLAVCTNRLANQASVQPSTTQPPSMLAVLPCCDNATKLDDTAHLCCSVFVVARARKPHRHGRAEAGPKLLQIGAAERAAIACGMYQPTNQPSKRSTLNHPACLLCFRDVTTPQRWMIRPTYAVLFLLLPATMPQWWMMRPANQFAR